MDAYHCYICPTVFIVDPQYKISSKSVYRFRRSDQRMDWLAFLLARALIFAFYAKNIYRRYVGWFCAALLCLSYVLGNSHICLLPSKS
jgi:hypothetical protein